MSVAPHRKQLLLDVALAGAAFAATIGLLSHGVEGSGGSTRHLDAVGVVIVAGTSFPLIAWRRSPLGVFATTITASAVLMALGYPGTPPLGATIALYLIAATRDEAHPWTRRTTALVGGLFAVHVAAFGFGHGKVPEVQLGFAALIWAVAWFAGERTRLRRQEIRELEQRAITAERDAQRDRRLAVAEERARIARDLHDSAAHAINVIAVQAGAARLLQHRDPERAHTALQTVEDVARDTVAEIDNIVHSLRDERATTVEVEPAPGLAALGTLLAQHSAAGLIVNVTTTGEPQSIGAAADQAAYRILQEALTNCVRHGVGPATVAVSFGEDSLALTVTNAVSAEAETRCNGGHGLVGMRERAMLLGGELDAERANGSFKVSARIPYGGAPINPRPAGERERSGSASRPGPAAS